MFSVNIYTQNVGIGTNNPTQKLDIDGQIRIRGGGPGAGKILTSDADGTASWTTPSSVSNWILSNGNVYRPTGNVGIGISWPLAQLEVDGTGIENGNILFKGQIKDIPAPPPVMGPGTRMMWYPDKAAFRAGHVTANEWDQDSIGYYSVAFGNNTMAKGQRSAAFGDQTKATGNNSFSSGEESSATARNATSFGFATQANSYSGTAIGSHNVGGGNATAWVLTDPLFEIGNGTSLSKSNAITVLKNGRTGINTSTPNAILHVNGNGPGGGNVLFAGTVKNEEDASAPPDNGPGTFMRWYPDKAAFRAGYVIADEWGKNNTGLYSTAFGHSTIAKGRYSVAFGFFSRALGNLSLSAGQGTEAEGDYSASFGLSTNATSYASSAIGRSNVGGGNPKEWISTDPIFEIGNGSGQPSNAFTVLKNGSTGINTHNPTAQLHINTPANENGLRVVIAGATRLLSSSTGGLSIGTATTPPNNGLRVTGESSLQQKVNIGNSQTADASLHIRHANATAGLMPDQGIRIQNMSGTNRFWTLYTFSSNGNLALYSSTGDGVSVGNFNAGTGAYTATSNRHLKTNVQLLDADVLNRIQQLQPASYTYIRDPLQQRTLGFMAEDVQPIFPELVDSVGENGENMAINYAGFSVVAIKAIQELMAEVNRLKADIHELKQKLAME